MIMQRVVCLILFSQLLSDVNARQAIFGKLFTKTEIKIIQGVPAQTGQFPWQAAIFHLRHNKSALCGGSLIAPQWVLTAAHCLYYYMDSPIFLWLGTTISYGPRPAAGNDPLQIFTPAMVIFHEDFQPHMFYNDVALIQLDRPAMLNKFVRPIKITDDEDVTVGDDVIVSGWGKIADEGRVVANLNYATLRVISTSDCQQYFDIPIRVESFCCLGVNLENTCSGDSGGPLIKYQLNGTPIQVGVVSFGTYSDEIREQTLCTMGFPTGYVRLLKFQKWIQQKIQPTTEPN